MRELEPLLQPGRSAEALTFLEKSENAAKVDPSKIVEVLHRVLELEKEKQDLKQLLGTES